MESTTPRRRDIDERQPTGWTVFAGTLMLIVGSLDALYGLAAILNNEIVFVGGQGVIIADVTTWGWIHLILGSIVAATGLGLFAAPLGSLGRRLLRLGQRGGADRLVPRRAAVGVPDDHLGRDDHLPAHRPLGGIRPGDRELRVARSAVSRFARLTAGPSQQRPRPPQRP